MRWNDIIIPTLKEEPHEIESASHRLLLRAGFIRMISSGLYSFLPLGLRVLERIINVIRSEMNRAGAQEVLLPAMQPGELWQKSGRWYEMGPELIRFKTRTDKDIVLGPTHEEVITLLAANLISSYRDLPVNFYQIQTKFRDEARPRFGLIRAKEFIMKDAYSFDADEGGLEKSYMAMHEAYIRIFQRLGISCEIVEAETGFMGGRFSQEFIAPSRSGEDIIVRCESCSYRANREKAEIGPPLETEKESLMEIEEVYTPGITTISDLEGFLGISPKKMIKTLIYKSDDEAIAVLISGDREVNEVKLQRALGTTSLSLADADMIQRVTGGPVGFSGPVGLEGVKILADFSIKNIQNGVTGANKKDYHLKNINIERDFKVSQFLDLSYPEEGDICPGCKGNLTLRRGLELGHIFKLGTKYSESLGAKFLDRNGVTRFAIMGCYGIGVTRAMASIVEQNCDKDGIIWPYEVAPFEVLVLIIDMTDDKVVKMGEELYLYLKEKGVSVLLDDRPVRAGIKFKDADLIGIPFRVNIGRRAIESGKIELCFRHDKKTVFISSEELLEVITERCPHISMRG